MDGGSATISEILAPRFPQKNIKAHAVTLKKTTPRSVPISLHRSFRYCSILQRRTYVEFGACHIRPAPIRHAHAQLTHEASRARKGRSVATKSHQMAMIFSSKLVIKTSTYIHRSRYIDSSTFAFGLDQIILTEK